MTGKRYKPKQRSCKGCAHYRCLNGSTGALGCHYIIDTGEPRGCPPENCDKRAAKLPQKVEFETPFNHEAYEVRRSRHCGDHEREIFRRGQERRSS